LDSKRETEVKPFNPILYQTVQQKPIIGVRVPNDARVTSLSPATEKGVSPLYNNLVTKSGYDWFCFNVTCFKFAQPLISFTFSGGIVPRTLCIFKLNFFVWPIMQVGCSTLASR